MASFNKVILMGNLTRDPEVRFTNNEMAICKVGLAVNRRYKDSQSGEWKEQPTFIDVTIFGRRGEAFAKYHQKGASAFIEGSLRMDTWEDKQSGQKRSKLYVVADDWEFVGGGRGAGAGAGGGGGGRDYESGSRGYDSGQDRAPSSAGEPSGGGGADFLEVDDTPF